MAETQTWRVVLATGEVREVECLYIGTVALAKVYGLRAEGVAVSGQGDNFVEAILDLARDGALLIVEVLAPGEPTRAELLAQLAAVTAERDVLRAQQAPLVALFDEVMAAARMAGIRGAGHEPAEVVLAVRRLGACEGAVVVRDAAMSVADDLAPDGPEASDCEWAHELMHRVAAAVARVREGGE